MILKPSWGLSAVYTNTSRCFNSYEGQTMTYNTPFGHGEYLKVKERSHFNIEGPYNTTFSPLVLDCEWCEDIDYSNNQTNPLTGRYANFYVDDHSVPPFSNVGGDNKVAWHWVGKGRTMNGQDMIRKLFLKTGDKDNKSIWSVGGLQEALINLNNWRSPSGIEVSNQFIGRTPGTNYLAWQLVVQVKPINCTDIKVIIDGKEISGCESTEDAWLKNGPLNRSGPSLLNNYTFKGASNSGLHAQALVLQVEGEATLFVLELGDSKSDRRVDIYGPVLYGQKLMPRALIDIKGVTMAKPVFEDYRVCVAGQERKIIKRINKESVLAMLTIPALLIGMAVIMSTLAHPAIQSSTGELLLAGAGALPGGCVRRDFRKGIWEKLFKPEGLLTRGMSFWINEGLDHTVLKASDFEIEVAQEMQCNIRVPTSMMSEAFRFAEGSGRHEEVGERHTSARMNEDTGADPIRDERGQQKVAQTGTGNK
ncbi:hypothetical protein OnM2_020104 [Erysiphe neolycopersici]|uniref:Uncharacterized protein n=1 Tax=Erysiphe neolycopersici TaxID=212602 RepID=A0A420I3N4_9PEZI|nr:hypothetical protein OnM2_020104 [Erysiphe neolycopersici]